MFYFEGCHRWTADDPRLNGHSNSWEAWATAQALIRLGFQVRTCAWNATPAIEEPVDYLFDIHSNLGKYAGLCVPGGVRHLHMTGSYPRFQNVAELTRVMAFEERHSIHYYPKRMVDEAAFEVSLYKADFCTLVGNEVTLATYPVSVHHKITLIPVTPSQNIPIKSSEAIRTSGKDFLFLAGGGAVHKGLDLAIEAIVNLPGVRLHVVGPFDEPDFWKAYRDNPAVAQRVVYHGFLGPESDEFRTVVESCRFGVLPSCSEATSTAAITMMLLGLIPILSSNCGLAIPKSTGWVLPNVDIDTLSDHFAAALEVEDDQAFQMATNAQAWVRQNNSREKFVSEMTGAIQSHWSS